MQAYLLNTETRSRIDFQYTPLELDLGGYQARYVSADIPQYDRNPLYYQGTQSKPRQVQVLLNNANAWNTIDTLNAWANLTPGKLAPPILLLQIGSLPPVKCVLTDVGASASAAKFNSAEKPTQSRVTLTVQPID